MFSNVPRQLAASGDGSVQRFRFRNAIERKRRYRELRGPIDWLEAAKLVRKCYPVKDRPSVPLWAQARQNIFKLYLFDLGLLGHMLGLTYAHQRARDFAFKGYVAENFVQTELTGRVAYPTFGWEQAQVELEFLHRARDGEIVPVEAKSGSRTRARSLRSYLARYELRRAIKLVGGPGGGDSEGPVEAWPLYHVQHLRDSVEGRRPERQDHGQAESCNQGGGVVGEDDRPVPRLGRRWRWMTRRHVQLPMRRRRTARTSPTVSSRGFVFPERRLVGPASARANSRSVSKGTAATLALIVLVPQSVRFDCVDFDLAAFVQNHRIGIRR